LEEGDFYFGAWRDVWNFVVARDFEDVVAVVAIAFGGRDTVTIGLCDENEVQRVLQATTPAQKLRAAERLYWSARQLKAAALRAEHPDWTDEAIRKAVREIFLCARS